MSEFTQTTPELEAPVEKTARKRKSGWGDAAATNVGVSYWIIYYYISNRIS